MFLLLVVAHYNHEMRKLLHSDHSISLEVGTSLTANNLISHLDHYAVLKTPNLPGHAHHKHTGLCKANQLSHICTASGSLSCSHSVLAQNRILLLQEELSTGAANIHHCHESIPSYWDMAGLALAPCFVSKRGQPGKWLV